MKDTLLFVAICWFCLSRNLKPYILFAIWLLRRVYGRFFWKYIIKNFISSNFIMYMMFSIVFFQLSYISPSSSSSWSWSRWNFSYSSHFRGQRCMLSSLVQSMTAHICFSISASLHVIGQTLTAPSIVQSTNPHLSGSPKKVKMINSSSVYQLYSLNNNLSYHHSL